MEAQVGLETAAGAVGDEAREAREALRSGAHVRRLGAGEFGAS